MRRHGLVELTGRTVGVLAPELLALRAGGHGSSGQPQVNAG